MLLLAPIIPFVTDHIWIQLYAKNKRDSIHVKSFPKTEKPDKAAKKILKTGATLTEFNSMVWNAKKDQSLSLRDPIDIKVPKGLKPFEKDLKLMHNLQKARPEPKPEKPEAEPEAAKKRPTKAKSKSAKPKSTKPKPKRKKRPTKKKAPKKKPRKRKA
jgi:valyl-tRNA synthetase